MNKQTLENCANTILDLIPVAAGLTREQRENTERVMLDAGAQIAIGLAGALLDIRDSLATIAGLYEGRNDDGGLLPNDRRR